MKKLNIKQLNTLSTETVELLLNNHTTGELISDNLIQILISTDDNSENVLTKQLDLAINTLTHDDLRDLKATVRTSLQTCIKIKRVQEAVLGKELMKQQKVTIKKVNSKMVEKGEFDATELGKFKVVFTAKDNNSKTFLEELIALQTKHGLSKEGVEKEVAKLNS